MKFILIVVWFGFPQQQQSPDYSSIARSQPLGVAMQEFDDKEACEAQARSFTSPYIVAKCSPKSSDPDRMPTVR